MKNNRLKAKEIIYQHIVNNSKEYILVTLVFVVGIFLGVMFINNIKEAQIQEITSYLNEFIDKFKNIEQLNNIEILKSTIIENLVLGIILWFFGTTVIRNTNSIWNNIISRILFRIYNIIYNNNNWSRKRIIIYIKWFSITKFNIYTMHNSNRSKWI